jgi:benzoyl-CoA reductase subunit D
MTGMIVSAGIDVGSSAVKVAIMASARGGGRSRPDARVLARTCERIRRRDQRHVIELAWRRALDEAGMTERDVDYLATTGEGELVEQRTGHFYGMTAHARGALFLDPEARAVLDAGALHARAIKMDEAGRVLAYRMTSQCASGSGQFLENIARYLGVTLDEVGELSRQADAPEKISGVCAVLAETDAINMVSRGISLPNILAGIHESMAQRFVKLLRSCEAGGVVLVTGGLAADEGLTAAMDTACRKHKTLDAVIRVHPHAVFAGALGAALWGAYRHERLQAAVAA